MKKMKPIRSEFENLVFPLAGVAHRGPKPLGVQVHHN